MKKIILTIILTALGTIVLTAPALATTIVSLSPANINAVSGNNFNVVIVVNPQGVKNYTAKIELDYPADVLEVKSFTLGNTWMPLPQPGYDLTDNANGVLIKTGGYLGGLSSSATFGTVSFYAKKAGSGVIKMGSGSLALDANSQNVISGTPEVAFVVTAPAPVVPEKPAPPVVPKKPVVPVPAVTPTAPAAPTPQPAAEQPVAQVEAKTSLAAAIGDILTLGTGNVLVGILVGLIILVIVAYAIYTLIQKKRKNL